MSVTSYNPRTGESLCVVDETSDAEVRQRVADAGLAAARLAGSSPAERRTWLFRMADALEEHSEELVALADRETALGTTRLTAEVSRTARQLRFYGDVALEGSYLGVTVDEATDTASRLVRVNRPLGPVAVFGASNFPFAFSVLGNDTGCAIAAGCPVLVKAHPAHVQLSLRLAEVASAALAAAGAPAGAFDVVVGQRAGVMLVQAPEVTAVAFTGSQSGGLALWKLANEREVVIPVYAEMGTVNPVVVTPGGAHEMAQVAAGFVGSFTLGSGQFCTKPGIMLAPAGAGAADQVARALEAARPVPVMLTRGIAEAVDDGLARWQEAGASLVIRLADDGPGWVAPAAVLHAPIDSLKPGSRLLEECFGPVALVCEYDGADQLAGALEQLQGSLAAALITSGEADPDAAEILNLLTSKVGRVVVDDWPTGVLFTWAQQHGGPWPSTSNPGATSVGAAGLARFVRPVAYQSVPDAWLPSEGRVANPWSLPRRVNGRIEPPVGVAR